MRYEGDSRTALEFAEQFDQVSVMDFTYRPKPDSDD